MNIILVLACCLFLNTVSLQHTKVIPLEKVIEAKFSPDGKHLVACGKKNIKVYDAHSGTVKGNLPNFPLQAYKSAQSPLEYQFSPQGTYFYATYTDRIWKLADLREHLPGLLAGRLIKLWSAHETVFLTAAQDAKPTANTWHVHNACDSTVLNSIDHAQYGNGIPLSPRIRPDGKLVAFIYETHNGFGHYGTKAVILNLNWHLLFGYDEQEITDAHHVEFCPDNEHALVGVQENQIWVQNYQNRRCIKIFTCASQTQKFDPREGRVKNYCTIKLQGSISTITNRLDPKEKYVITQNGHHFTCTKVSKLGTPEIVSKSPTGKFSVIQKNKKRSPYGGKFYDIFLQKKDSDNPQETCLLTQIYKTPKNITFAGSHDEHLILIDPIKDILYIFDPYTGQELEKIEYRSFEISPGAHAFIAKSKENDEQKEQRVLYILPSAAQLLGKEHNSYFSVLPEDLRNYLRYFQTPQDDSTQASHD